MFMSCSSNESKAKKLIDEYLKSELENSDSYSPVSWGRLQHVDSLILYDARYLAHLENLHTQKSRLQELNAKILKSDGDTQALEELLALTEKRLHSAIITLERYKYEYEYAAGWSISHGYSFYNNVGELEIRRTNFYITEDIKTVVSLK